MPKLLTGQKPYTLLVANLKQGSDPSKGPAGNPQKMRSTYTRSHFQEIGRTGDYTQEPGDVQNAGLHTKLGALEGESSPATTTITIANNDFSAVAKLLIGDFTLISNVDFTVGGSTTATATALATAIDNLPGFSASPSGSDVLVTGANGPAGNKTRLKAIYDAGIQNYTLTPFAGGMPTIVGPILS